MLIIFDCDGVLVDSERLAARIFSDALMRIGIEMDERQCYQQFHGKTLDDCYLWIETTRNTCLPPFFHSELTKETQRQFSEKLEAVDGVERVIRYLMRKKTKFCVASNGSHEKMVNSLRVTGLLDYFPHRFSSDDVARGKPDPELFLFAARSMSETPSNTLVIEDSAAGAEAALAAEMRLVMYQSEEASISGQHLSFFDMDSIYEHLRTF